MMNKLAQEIHENNKLKGFYEDDKNIGEMLMLTVSELSEALEADRKNKYSNYSSFDEQASYYEGIEDTETGKLRFHNNFKDNIKDTFEDEIADTIIRLLDIAAFKGIDIERHINLKMKFNSMRPYKHDKKY